MLPEDVKPKNLALACKKIIVYNGIEVPLFNTEALLSVIGIQRLTFNRWLNADRIPEAMFRDKRGRFYSIWEMKTVRDATNTFGKPFFTSSPSERSLSWEKYVKEQWTYIRQELIAGRQPETTLELFYDDIKDLVSDIRIILRKQGFDSEQLANKIAHHIAYKGYGKLMRI